MKKDPEDDVEFDDASIAAFEKCEEFIKQGSYKSVVDIIQHFPEIVNFVEEDNHNTLLHLAASVNNLPIAKLLLEKGAEVYENKAGKTPQMIAADMKGKGIAMKQFLEKETKRKS